MSARGTVDGARVVFATFPLFIFRTFLYVAFCSVLQLVMGSSFVVFICAMLLWPIALIILSLRLCYFVLVIWKQYLPLSPLDDQELCSARLWNWWKDVPVPRDAWPVFTTTGAPATTP